MNTRDKRASVLGLGLAALLVLPEPGALDQGDRQQLAYCYRGISPTNAADSLPSYTYAATWQTTKTYTATWQTTASYSARWD